MSIEMRKELEKHGLYAIIRYYFGCPRCESISTAYVSNVQDTENEKIYIYKWVCQECCHIFEVMIPEDVKEKTGWVD